MNLSIRSLLVWLALVLALAGADQGLRAQGPKPILAKIGFVSSLDVLYGSQSGQAEISKVQSYLEESQKEYDSRRLELERLREQFETQQRSLNPQTRLEMQEKIKQTDIELKRFQEDTQVEISRRRDVLLTAESEKIQNIITEYAQGNAYQVIFLRSDEQVYVDPVLDLTSEIIRIYDRKYPVSGDPTSPQ